MLSKNHLETISHRQKITMSMTIIILMLTSTMLALVQDLSSEETAQTVTFREGEKITQTSPVQSTEQGGQGSWNGAQDQWQLDNHPILSDTCGQIRESHLESLLTSRQLQLAAIRPALGRIEQRRSRQ